MTINDESLVMPGMTSHVYMPDQQTIEKPKTVKTPKVEDVMIHVMPKEFFGKEAGVKEIPKKPVARVPAPPPKPVPVKPAVLTQKKKSKTNIVLIIIGFVVIVAFAAGAYVVVKSLEEPQIVEDKLEVVDIPEMDEEPVEVVPVTFPGKDTDGDGLTDKEETLYGTDFRNPDTDGDTFLDGNEVFHRYDPLGFSPSTLLDTGSVVEYDAQGGYTLTYPKQWSVATREDGMEFKSSTGASISLDVYQKQEDQKFSEWYQLTIPAAEREVFLEDMTKEGYLFYKYPDLMTAFVEVEDQIFLFTYTVNEAPTIDFLKTFQMMVNSLMVELK
jgi:hypothetical protein